MAKISARNARLLLSGRDFSGHTNNITLDLTVDTPEVTTFADNTVQNLHGGVKANELTSDGFFATGASQVDAELFDMVAQPVLTGFYPYLYSASQTGYEFTGVLSKYNMKFGTNDAAGMSLTVTGGSTAGVLRGQVLAGTTVSAVGTSNLGSVDFGGYGATTYAILHVISLTGTTPKFSASI
jgi:hypothetical protein